MHKLHLRQIGFFFIAFIPVTKLFILPSIIASFSSNDLWLSIFLTFIFDFLTLIAIYFIGKKFKGKNFYEILTTLFGKVMAKIIFCFYFFYFLVKAYIPILEQKGYVEITLYETSPTILTFLPFFLISIYLCTKKIIVLGRVADVLGFVTFFSLLFIFALSLSNSHFHSILPIGVNGIGKILKGSYFSLPWFGDSLYLLFFLGHYGKEKKGTLKLFISYAIAVLLTIFFYILFYATFTSISTRQNFALTEISKYSSVISLVGRFDYIGIFAILFSCVFSIILPVYFASFCLQTVIGVKYKIITSLICNAILFFVITAFEPFFAGIQGAIQQYFGWYFFLVGNILPVVLLFFKDKNTNIKGRTNEIY